MRSDFHGAQERVIVPFSVLPVGQEFFFVGNVDNVWTVHRKTTVYRKISETDYVAVGIRHCFRLDDLNTTVSPEAPE